jgi:hypothetical protein
MKFLQIHDIPRLANQGGGELAEILAIVACAVVAGLIFWIMKLDKQKEKMAEYQQENDKATLTALNAVTTMLDAVKTYLPEMKGDIKEEINSKGDVLKVHLDQVVKQVEEAKSEIRQHLTKRNGN